jgi:hypothetical protein
MYHVCKLLQNSKSNIVTINKNKKFFIIEKFAYTALISALMRKHIPLCLYHYNKAYNNVLDLKNINPKFINANGDLKLVISSR